MVVEGKTWTVLIVHDNSSFSSDICTYYLQGDTMINDITYKKFYEQCNGTVKCMAALREEDKKVYIIVPNPYSSSNAESCLYDFGLKAGRVNFDSIDFVVTTEYKDYCKKPLLTLSLTSDDAIYYNEVRGTWIEGVGSIYAPFVIFRGLGDGYTVLSCNIGNDTIYNDTITAKLLKIQRIKNDEQNKVSQIYDLSGRKLSAPPAQGIYIKDRKKYLSR